MALLYALGATGFFTSRAFVPAWATAVVLRYGDMLPVLKQVEFLQATGSEPIWFTSNWTIALLTVLAALEVASGKSAEARQILDEFQTYAKAGIAAVATLGVFGASDVAFARELLTQTAGVIDSVMAALVAFVVFIGSTLRKALMDLLVDADPDDSLGLQNLFSWGEDIWGLFGVIFFFIYPLGIGGLVVIVFALLYLARRYREHKEQRSRMDCAACGAKMYPSARFCPACGTANPQVHAIGFFGTAIDRLVDDTGLHRFRLASKRRCMRCAGRLKQRSLPQTCPDCKAPVLADKDDQTAYLQTVAERLPKTLGISFLLSLLPVIGIVPGIIYYRIQLLAPFRVYLPATHGLLLKWLLRIVFLLLISLQVIPGAGGIALPIMATISYFTYRSWFVSRLPAANAVA